MNATPCGASVGIHWPASFRSIAQSTTLSGRPYACREETPGSRRREGSNQNTPTDATQRRRPVALLCVHGWPFIDFRHSSAAIWVVVAAL